MAKLHRGQLVECINDMPLTKDGLTLSMDGLTRGKIYTVDWYGTATPSGGPSRAKCVTLIEIADRADNCPYLASRFTPVDDGRLSIFRLMLAKRNSKKATYA